MKYRYNEEINIPAGAVTVTGNLVIPREAKAVIVFAHGSGSSRFSSRNQAVARYLQEKGFGTLLFDLLTPIEDMDYATRFDINRLSIRLAAATEWLAALDITQDMAIGFFGASTGAAAALKAAAKLPWVAAVVSRGGRPDLAGADLEAVKAPVLLIVGGSDKTVLELNQEALRQLPGIKKLEVVEGASHLFEEAGKMDIVATLAADWFSKYLHTL